MPACAREMIKDGWCDVASFLLLLKFKTKTSSDQSDSVVQQHGNVVVK